MDFITENSLKYGSWQSFERAICRLLQAEGFENVRIVGGSGDKGADILATRFNKRWLFQAKQWNKPVGIDVVQETINAQAAYNAHIPVIVASRGFDVNVHKYRTVLMSQGINLQLWDSKTMLDHFSRLSKQVMNQHEPREYQENAIAAIVQAHENEYDNKALIVLATGLGKTFVAAEAIRRINLIKKSRVLVLAHTNPLVYQLDRSFWPFLLPTQSTVVWNGYEHPSKEILETSDFVFACIDTVSEAIKHGNEYDFDIIIVDECHHAGSPTYQQVLNYFDAGKAGPFLIGLTATPWRPDEVDINSIFGDPKIQIDMVYGMKHGFLTNVDYRMHTDNIDWNSIEKFVGKAFSPKQINKTFFINQWDDAVVEELARVWKQQANPRGIVFCGTIDHAIQMKERINALGFCNAATIHSQMDMFSKNKTLSDFADGLIDVICTVDIFNEGLDVPDVNILVFQRVTHSRRIFIQQLGRGLRISKDKHKVIVLDFVSDIRRFAAGLDLKNKLYDATTSVRVDLPYKVTFKRVDGDDPKAENFLRQWLEDVATIENADEDASILKYPPEL